MSSRTLSSVFLALSLTGCLSPPPLREAKVEAVKKKLENVAEISDATLELVKEEHYALIDQFKGPTSFSGESLQYQFKGCRVLGTEVIPLQKILHAGDSLVLGCVFEKDEGKQGKVRVTLYDQQKKKFLSSFFEEAHTFKYEKEIYSLTFKIHGTRGIVDIHADFFIEDVPYRSAGGYACFNDPLKNLSSVQREQ